MPILSALLAVAAASNAQPASDAASIDGSWRNPGGSVVVAIAPCGDAYCGTVAWASEQAQADARRGGTDPLIGTQLMTGFKAAGPGKWRGRLFIPDLNRRSKAELRMVGDDWLKVTGCAVGRVICKSQYWTRSSSGDVGR